MGFIQRAFTPPGTGGREAQAIIAQAEARDAAAVKPAPSLPQAPTQPGAPPQFAPGQAPGAKQRAQISATSMLGAAATGGQQSKKTMLGA